MTIQPTEGRKVPTWSLPDRLRKAREVADMDQGALARALGVSRNTVSNAERGAVEPRRAVVMAWAMATGVDLDWLVEGSEKPRPDGPDGAVKLPQLDSNQQPFD